MLGHLCLDTYALFELTPMLGQSFKPMLGKHWTPMAWTPMLGQSFKSLEIKKHLKYDIYLHCFEFYAIPDMIYAIPDMIGSTLQYVAVRWSTLECVGKTNFCDFLKIIQHFGNHSTFWKTFKSLKINKHFGKHWTPMLGHLPMAWTPMLGHLCLDTCAWTPMLGHLWSPPDWQTDEQAGRLADRQMNRQADRQMNRQADRQMNWQTDR